MSPSDTKIEQRPRGKIIRGFRKVQPWHVASLWCLLMLPLLAWGLPTSRNDKFLFGGEPAWPAEKYEAARALRELRERNAGADTDLDPLLDRSNVIDVTCDDGHRGEILLRYRLYSHQPDEMITFRALQRMKPRQRDFDPRLYQYGGGYIYMIGAALGASSVTGYTKITGDLNVYLTSPDLFGRFYVVARAVSVIFGGLALVATFRLAARAAGRFAGWAALLIVATSPVFLSGALEAKPHLPAAAMGLWAVEFAIRVYRFHRVRDAVNLGLTAGYAIGLVLTGAASLLTIAALFVLGKGNRKRILVLTCVAAAITVVTYFATNPYVLINAVRNPAVLSSNLSNSTAMYSAEKLVEGMFRVAFLILESVGWASSLAGLFGLGWLLRRRFRTTLIAAASGIGLVLLCCVIGAGKPVEFARFLVLPSCLLCVSAAVLAAKARRRTPLAGVGVVAACLLLGNGWRYVRSFWADGLGDLGTRALAADWFVKNAGPGDRVGILQEPAPYCVPPLDFAHRKIFLLPKHPNGELLVEQLPEWMVFADDCGLEAGPWAGWGAFYEPSAGCGVSDAHGSNITWANKRIFVYHRK